LGSQVWGERTIIEHPDQWELDVIPPLRSITIILDVTPPELELAVATSGASLCPAMMRAIVAAMVVDATSRPAQP
jgi:hypothetical protein